MQGRRFGGNASESDVREWIESLNLNLGGNTDVSSFNLSAGVNGKAPTVRLSSGYDMPILGLDTYSLHGDVCKNSVKAALASGFRKFDTASIYGNEEEIGEAIRESDVPREEIFVTTKLYPNQFANAEAAIEECLEKLILMSITLTPLHHPGTNDVAAYKAMERAVAQGKIRSLEPFGLLCGGNERDSCPRYPSSPYSYRTKYTGIIRENDVIPYMRQARES